jgi:hypothetical protein
MASVVLNNSQFPVANANLLVCDGISVGAGGLQLPDSGLVANGTVVAQEVTAAWVVSDTSRLQNTLVTNGGGTARIMGNAIGTQVVENAYYSNAQQTNYQCPTWNATYNYTGVHNYVLVVYGTNTAAVGAYPNNIFYALDSAPTPPVVGVPPTLTPAPYPAGGGVPSAGWLLAKDSVAQGGASVVGGTGGAPLLYTILSGYSPAQSQWFGGGGASIGISAPRGLTLVEGGDASLDGALLDLAGVVKADGISLHNTDQNLSPASSYGAVFAAGDTAFTIGRNYTWTATAPGATTYQWVGAAGTAGQITLSGGAGTSAFDVASIMMVTRKYVPLAAHAIGNLCVDTKSNTAMVISSRASADQSLVVADVGQIEWIAFNPNWASV